MFLQPSLQIMLVTPNIKPAHFAALYKSGLSECQWRILKHDYKKKKWWAPTLKYNFPLKLKPSCLKLGTFSHLPKPDIHSTNSWVKYQALCCCWGWRGGWWVCLDCCMLQESLNMTKKPHTVTEFGDNSLRASHLSRYTRPFDPLLM